jgi:hypothetical protein
MEKAAGGLWAQQEVVAVPPSAQAGCTTLTRMVYLTQEQRLEVT